MDAHDFAPGAEAATFDQPITSALRTHQPVHLVDLETIHQRIKNPDFTPETASPISEADLYKYDGRLADLDCTDIRLMELLPGGGAEPLTCHLRNYSLDDEVQYETLSYCWGRPILFDAEITIEEHGVLPITTNLHKALVQLRYADRPRLLWADIVCINQQDVEERTVQVQLMRRIFSKCHRVVIWLGDGTVSSNLAMVTIVDVHLALEKKEAAGDRRHLHDLTDAERARYGLIHEQSPGIDALIDLYQRPWFHRVWIIQELALPPSAMLVCGNMSIAWSTFMLVLTKYSPSLKKFSTTENLGENHVRLSICPSWEEARVKASPPLLTLVARARNAQATDPRDKVFALVGLASERGEAGILGTPDYRLSVEQVYKQFVLENISTYRNLDVLSLVHSRSSEVNEVGEVKLKLPSWVPDLSVRGIPYPLIRLDKFALDSHATLRTKKDYQRNAASRSTEASFELENDNETLRLSGYVFQIIGDQLGRPFPGCTQWSDVPKKQHAQANAWASWEDIVGMRRKTMIGHEHAYDVYWKTLRGGELPEHYEVARFDLLNGYERPLKPYRILSFGQVITSPTMFFVLHKLSCLILDVLNTIYHLLGYPAIEYTRGIGTNVCEYRRMGKTVEGAICLLPDATRSGDSLALFKGGKVPYVVRQSGKKWKFVGEAYVHGVMNGEAWDSGRCVDMWIS